jgi:hypothetical protein
MTRLDTVTTHLRVLRTERAGRWAGLRNANLEPLVYKRRTLKPERDVPEITTLLHDFDLAFPNFGIDPPNFGADSHCRGTRSPVMKTNFTAVGPYDIAQRSLRPKIQSHAPRTALLARIYAQAIPNAQL